MSMRRPSGGAGAVAARFQPDVAGRRIRASDDSEQLCALQSVGEDLKPLRRAVLEAPHMDHRELCRVAALLEVSVRERDDGVAVGDQLVDVELELVPAADGLLERLKSLRLALVLAAARELGGVA